MAIGDLNADGRLDLAVAAEGSDRVSVPIGTGAGGFNPRTRCSTGDDPRDVAIGDLNGDGKFDLVAASHPSDNVTVLPTR